jgi:hypothetical protein
MYCGPPVLNQGAPHKLRRMTMEPWWQDAHLWVQVLVAFGTLAVAFSALYGDWFKRKYYPPKLLIELASEVGSRAMVQFRDPPTDETILLPGRYYHVVVSNKGSTATDVGVFLTLVKQRDVGGGWRTAWSGKAMLSWPETTMQPFPRSIARTPATVNLVGLVKDKWLQLMVVIPPLALPSNEAPGIGGYPGRFRQQTEMVLGVQALAVEGESDMKQFHIAWDGGWADGDSEIVHHLSIKPYKES